MEVETPLLSHGISLDAHLDVFASRFWPGGFPSDPAASLSPSAGDSAPPSGRERASRGETLYLQTSPEFLLKRLLAAGYPDLFQLGKVFRNGEAGPRHNPEFTLLEWYRLGYSLEDMMREAAQVAMLVLGRLPVRRLSYAEAFAAALGMDPLTADDSALDALLQERFPEAPSLSTRDERLDFLLLHAVEPTFPPEALLILHRFPVSQASLAKADPRDPRVALRFEIYHRGFELCNAYEELGDPSDHERRFRAENAKRERWGKPVLPVDGHFLGALEAGLPPCSGCALGMDRLLALGAGLSSIQPMLTFPLPIS